MPVSLKLKNIEKKYNRIIVIGNGFDIALGLNSSYKSFIENYFKDIFLNVYNLSLEYTFYETHLIRVDISYQNLSLLKEEYNLESLDTETILTLDYVLKRYATIEYKYEFFKEILFHLNKENWVDVEQLYYDRLKSYYKEYQVLSKKSTKEGVLNKIKSLNKCMDKITLDLTKYIKSEQNQITIDNSPLISLIDNCDNQLNDEIRKLQKKYKDLTGIERIVFINFNYTNTLIKTLKKSRIYNKSEHIYIHGSVNTEENPIIFGYGDDTGEFYKDLESSGQNELLKKIKSFQYPRTNNYHKLLSVLDSKEFEVFIIGHSCGLSDRTLLKTMFEHDNCLGIKNFHYKEGRKEEEEEDFYKRMDISRHFTDKIKMRERVLPLDRTAKIPQVKNK
ncbi:AbiH family protein [Tenacibaculum aiptasiae]|uniref:AbiH family protein n=1 Tax=Tenacibaculum aiptasiae TaxID=426481 RepID=UPI0023301600|nr:AbiH family protein [Tenacibaculum aiptasiae]